MVGIMQELLGEMYQLTIKGFLFEMSLVKLIIQTKQKPDVGLQKLKFSDISENVSLL